MKAAELRNKSKEEMIAELITLSREQFNLRMQKGTGQQVNTSKFKEIRRNIARINTVLKEKAGV
jgi:large subunit ribosomal protein L29